MLRIVNSVLMVFTLTVINVVLALPSFKDVFYATVPIVRNVMAIIIGNYTMRFAHVKPNSFKWMGNVYTVHYIA
jgi:hypothetical protein